MKHVLSHAVRYRTIQTVNMRGFRPIWTSCPFSAYWTGSVTMELTSYNMLFSNALNLSFSPLCLTFSSSYQTRAAVVQPTAIRSLSCSANVLQNISLLRMKSIAFS